MKRMPLCDKCANAIIEQQGGNDWYKIVGCKECPEIHDYYDAKRLCPVFKELEE